MTGTARSINPAARTTADRSQAVAIHSIAIMADGDLSDFRAVIAPGAVNHEDVAEPSAARGGGPDAFHATALWLRSAFADLHHRVENAMSDGDLVAVDTTMSGRHVAPFAVYTAAGQLDQVWSPTGKTFAVRQTHWFRTAELEGRAVVTEHWAVRDDLGQGRQLGWIPPSLPYLLRCALAKRRVARAERGSGR